MRLTPDEIREWLGHSSPQPLPLPEPQVVGGRLEGARLLADQLGRRLPALRTLLEHQIRLMEAGLGVAAGGTTVTEDRTTSEQEEVQ